MARPVTKPPSKFTGVDLSLDVISAYERALADLGITKRELFERALLGELSRLGLQHHITPNEEALAS